MRSPLVWTVAGGRWKSELCEEEDPGGAWRRIRMCWIRCPRAKATNPVTLYTVGQGPAWWVVPSLGFLLKVCRKSRFYYGMINSSI
ncbi:hypothetical protein CORC01_14257 [Colletotrichum orchidophilum]|uniref:Uncharacterized protein n=1 Tax=Colletotrichum orchidophilum TaxID=1209926 RepID=A0A1G4AMY8_9PEZI|nr:uncharacterized protein CORC01_14257 [Colletotrichum orchidophilum]OHE90445.1 hypothetical protein CORC01_14257 [Colletotrichum orchidophilum]